MTNDEIQDLRDITLKFLERSALSYYEDYDKWEIKEELNELDKLDLSNDFDKYFTLAYFGAVYIFGRVANKLIKSNIYRACDFIVSTCLPYSHSIHAYLDFKLTNSDHLVRFMSEIDLEHKKSFVKNFRDKRTIDECLSEIIFDVKYVYNDDEDVDVVKLSLTEAGKRLATSAIQIAKEPDLSNDSFIVLNQS